MVEESRVYLMKEIEVKTKVRDKDTLLAKLSELGIELSSPVIQRDRIFFPNGKLPDGISKEPALRIREQNGEYLFTYKKPDTNHLDKIEFETKIADPEAMANIFEALGFREIARINKTRQKAKYQDYEICVDEIENLGSYVEVEKMVQDGDANAIQTELFSFLGSLGVSSNDRIYKGYDVLIIDQHDPFSH
jgi:adenylate cyclase, class 2